MLSVFDNEFAKYGRVITGIDFTELFEECRKTPIPAEGTCNHNGSYDVFEALPVYEELKNKIFGGMPLWMDYCNGWCHMLNAFEYHKTSEVMIYLTDTIGIYGSYFDIKNNSYDTSKAELFFIPAGTGIETYASTLHYFPCNAHKDTPINSICVLPKGTNGPAPAVEITRDEDKLLRGFNKWLIAHPDSPDAAAGAYVGMTGVNIDVSSLQD